MTQPSEHCAAIGELIGPYVDDDLPREARRRVEEHLLTCPTCAWEAQTQRLTRDRLREGAGEAVASDALRARLLRRLFADNPHCADPEPAQSDASQIRLPISLEN